MNPLLGTKSTAGSGVRHFGRYRWQVGVVAMTAAVMVVAAPGATAAPVAPAVPVTPAVVHVGQIARQDVPALPGSEPDTLVEPDIAIAPANSNVAGACYPDRRDPVGGALGIGTAFSKDGGAPLHHKALCRVPAHTRGHST